MSRFVFPYGIRFQEDGRIEVFPAAEIFVLGKTGLGIRALFHVDSGATTSIMPSSDARALGLNAGRGKKMMVRGISGEPFIGYRHSVMLQFNDFRFRAPIIFVENFSIPRILGREGVFSQFGIVFDEMVRRIALLDNHKARKDIDSLFR